jgi:hypothetical protein
MPKTLVDEYNAITVTVPNHGPEIQSLVQQSLRSAMSCLEKHSKLVGFQNVDESTFRSFVLAEIMRLDPDAKCQTEWQRFDLLVQAKDQNAVLEFKFFYGPRRTKNLDGSDGAWKGGPSLKNEREFQQCVEKLIEERRPEIEYKFLVLVYRKGISKIASKHSYESSYSNLSRFKIQHFEIIDHEDRDNVACNLIHVV